MMDAHASLHGGVDPGHASKAPWSLSLAATAAALAASVALAVAPVYSVTTNGNTEHQTLPDAEGAWTLALLAVPVLLAALPLLVPTRAAVLARTVGAVILFVGAFVSVASIGIFYLPAAALAVIGAALGWADSREAR